MIDLYDEAFQADPYPTYERLRSQSPLVRLDNPAVWLMSRHADVNEALRNPGVYSSSQGVAFNDGAGEGALIAADDPDHTRLRRLLNKQFTPRSVAELEEDVRRTTASIVNQLPGPGSSVDFAATLAAELPTRVIADYLGIDPENWASYKQWSDVVNEVIWAREPTLEQYTAAGAGGGAAVALFTQAIADRRTSFKPDLIGRLVAATDTADALTDHETIQFCFLLMLAGNVTTSSVLNHSMLLLLQHPEQQQALRDDPRLIPAAIDEVLRFESPLQGFMRTLTQDVELHTQRMRAGDKVMMLYGSANRDESVFPRADQFDISRDTSGHIAFGAGPHFCLGSWLARLEVTIMLEALLPLMPCWSLDPSRRIVRTGAPAFREIRSLPLLLG